jgi:anti-sigma factor ChrR (cupin superfamily)
LWSDWHPGIPFRRTFTRLERLAGYIDGTLERVEHRRVSEHVRTCEPCLRLLREARALLAAEDASSQV